MKELKPDKLFPRDPGTLWVIRGLEAYLNLKNRDINKLGYTELIKYIDQIAVMLLKK